MIEAAFLESKPKPKPTIRKTVTKPIPKPQVSNEQAITVQQVQATPRVTTTSTVKSVGRGRQIVLQFSNKSIKIDSKINPTIPKVIDPSQPIPYVVTYADLPVSDAPDAFAFSTPLNGGSGEIILTSRSINLGPVQTNISAVKEPIGMETFLEATYAAETGLGDMPTEIRLGGHLLPPIPHNELGAAIITDPKTGQPTGYFQMCYVQFRQAGANPLFRVDPTALSFLLKWMSINTKIRGRLAGRVLPLDDTRILDSPMLYMNGTRAIRFRDVEKPEALHFMFYAATHGKISDYKHYIPPKERIEPFPGRAPQVMTNPPALD